MKLGVMRKRNGFGEWKTSLKYVDNIKLEDPFGHQRDSRKHRSYAQ